MSKRLYVQAAYQPGATLRLTKDQSHYILRVLRLRTGDKIEVFNNQSECFGAEITVLKNHVVELVLGTKTAGQVKHPKQALAVAVSSAQKVAWIVQKATELAVTEIWLLETEFSQNNASNRVETIEKLERLHKIAISACQQSGVNRVPRLHQSMPLQDWLSLGWSQETLLIADPRGSAYPTSMPKDKQTIWIVGPEGGFSAIERQACIQQGALPVKLATSILRMETACIAALTIGQQAYIH